MSKRDIEKEELVDRIKSLQLEFNIGSEKYNQLGHIWQDVKELTTKQENKTKDMLSLLKECEIQLRRLNEKFGETTDTNEIISKLLNTY
jgi:hypothetical protein